MSLNILLCLTLLALIFGYMRWRRIAGFFGLLAVALFFGIGCGPLAMGLARELQSEFLKEPALDWTKRSVIVLLGGGTERIDEAGGAVEVGTLAYPRVFRTAELYRACRAVQAECKIIVSGGDPQRHGQAEAEAYAARLLAIGVAAADLVVENKSLNTWQNASYVQPLLAASKPEQVIVVTSGIHLRRSLLYFAHFGMHPTPVRADYLSASLTYTPSALNFAVTDWAMHEYVGIARYYVYNRMGWNSPPAAAGSP